MAEKYDLVVLGAGPGGYVAALHAAGLGLKAAIVEKEQVGGVCLNVGCIPTKALLASAQALETARRGSEFGFSAGEIRPDYPTAFQRSRGVADVLRRGIEGLFKRAGVELVRARGRLAGPGAVALEAPPGAADRPPKRLEARAVILAAGSRPKVLPGLEPDGDRIWTSREAVLAEAAPASLAVIGGGAIGVEFATIFRAFGSEVTVIEALEHLLPLADRDAVRVLERVFARRGIAVRTAAPVARVEKTGAGVSLELKGARGPETVTAERVLVAVGRTPNSEDLGLETAGIVPDERGFIPVDEHGLAAAGVYAVGDLIATPQLAHAASAEGILAVNHLAGQNPAPLDYGNMPAVTYGRPEVASLGLTEEQARAAGGPVLAEKLDFRALGRARAAGEVDGLIKVIAAGDSGKILGVHIAGPEAAELLHEFIPLRQAGLGVAALADAVHAHPTLAEGAGELGRSLAAKLKP